MAAVSKLPANWLKDLSPEAVAYLQKLEKQASAAPDLSGITVPDEANTTATVTTRTVDDDLNGVAGTDAGTDPISIGNSGGTTVNDSFTIIAHLQRAIPQRRKSRGGHRYIEQPAQRRSCCD